LEAFPIDIPETGITKGGHLIDNKGFNQ
jgi:hypothetical protein